MTTLSQGADHGGDGMGIDRSGTGRRKLGAGLPVWLGRFRLVACLGACAIMGPSALQAQPLPTALEQLRAAVGLVPSGVRPVAPPRAGSPSQGASPAAIRLIPVPSETPLPKVPEPVEEGQRPTASPPLLPVEVRIAAPTNVPAVLELPTPKPSPAEDVPTVPALLPAVAIDPVGPPASPSARWETVGVVLCLALIGAFFLMAVVLVSRWLGLTIRIRVSLGAAHPDVEAGTPNKRGELIRD